MQTVYDLDTAQSTLFVCPRSKQDGSYYSALELPNLKFNLIKLHKTRFLQNFNAGTGCAIQVLQIPEKKVFTKSSAYYPRLHIIVLLLADYTKEKLFRFIFYFSEF